MNDPIPENYYWIDVVRFVAILQIIIIHVSGPFFYNFANLKAWLIASSYDTFCRPGVPLFLMISGALLLSRKGMEAPTVFFRKRILKLAIPFIAWSFIYALFVMHQSHSLAGIWIIMKQIYSGQVMYHLPFINILLGLYLVIPIIKIYTDNSSLNNQFYFLLLWFFATAIVSTIAKFSGLNCGIIFAVVTGFIGYYLAGLVIKNHDLPWSTSKKIVLCLLLILLFFLIGEVGTYKLIIREKIPDEFFYEYLSPNVIIASLAMLYLIKSCRDSINKACQKYLPVQKVLVTFREITYGVFFIHVLVLMKLASHFHLDANSFNPIFSIPLVAIITLCISAVLILIIRKIPILRSILC